MLVVDPITLEVITEGLVSIVREMRATVFRTARSVAIWEAKDFSCGLFSAAAEVIAQSEDIGGHVVPLPWHVRAAHSTFRNDFAPGDLIAMNDPYCGGTHLNDVTLLYPIFQDGQLAFFAAVREHWSDVGGAVPGSLSGSATDIYQEGIRIPPIKLIEAGRMNQAAMDLLLANMRVREERIGDFRSGLSACRVAEGRLGDIVAQYGADKVLAAVRQGIDRAEARMREQISRLPDGTYLFEDYLETFAEDGLEPLRLPLALKIDGDELTADFTGASPQVPVPVNSTLAVTTGGVIITLKAALDPRAAMNHGSFRPITVIAPEGTIVNVTHPAPAGSHGELRKRVMATMIGALSQAVPELVTGDVHRTSFHNMLGGVDPRTRREYVHYEWGSGGNGGFAEADGPSSMGAVDWGGLFTVQSTEVIEQNFPLVVQRCDLAPGSGGNGRRRGGLGLRRELKVVGDRATYSLLSDGAVLPAFGIEGGLAAAPVSAHVRRAGREIAFDTPGKVGGFPLRREDVLVLQAAGGGGYGDPLEREPEHVAEDLREGYIDERTAHDVYGVVINGDGRADEVATRARRGTLAGRRHMLRVVAAKGELYRAGQVSQRRICPLHSRDLFALGLSDGAIVELSSGSGAPLRAWCAADDGVAAGTVPLDDFGRAALRVSEGVAVQVRPLAAI